MFVETNFILNTKTKSSKITKEETDKIASQNGRLVQLK